MQLHEYKMKILRYKPMTTLLNKPVLYLQQTLPLKQAFQEANKEMKLYTAMDGEIVTIKIPISGSL